MFNTMQHRQKQALSWLLATALCGGLGVKNASAAESKSKKAAAPSPGQMARLGGAPTNANRAILGEKGKPKQGAVGGN